VRAVDGTETAWIDKGFGFAVAATTSRDELLPIAEAIYRGPTPKG
jgi:anti-sigma factor RsiW